MVRFMILSLSTRNIGYRWQDIAQIIGCYLLNEISVSVYKNSDNFISDEDNYSLNIKRVAFYKARYGEIEYIDISFFDRNVIEATKRKMALYFYNNPNLIILIIGDFHILREIAEN